MLLTPTDLPTIIISSCLWDYLFTTLRVVIYLLLGMFVFGANLGNGNYLGAFHPVTSIVIVPVVPGGTVTTMNPALPAQTGPTSNSARSMKPRAWLRAAA